MLASRRAPGENHFTVTVNPSGDPRDDGAREAVVRKHRGEIARAGLLAWDAAALVEIVLHGVPGTPMPPWAPELSAADAQWLVARLKEGPP